MNSCSKPPANWLLQSEWERAVFALTKSRRSISLYCHKKTLDQPLLTDRGFHFFEGPTGKLMSLASGPLCLVVVGHVGKTTVQDQAAVGID